MGVWPKINVVHTTLIWRGRHVTEVLLTTHQCVLQGVFLYIAVWCDVVAHGELHYLITESQAQWARDRSPGSKWINELLILWNLLAAPMFHIKFRSIWQVVLEKKQPFLDFYKMLLERPQKGEGPICITLGLLVAPVLNTKFQLNPTSGSGEVDSFRFS